MNPFRAFLAALLIAAAAMGAGPVLAGIERAPLTGAPAWVIDVPAGFTADRNERGALFVRSSMFSGILQLRVIPVPATEQPTLEDMAAAVFQGAQAAPVSRTVPFTVDGLSGKIFHSRTEQGGDGPSWLQVWIVRIDADHVGLLGIRGADTLTPAQTRTLEALARTARIARTPG